MSLPPADAAWTEGRCDVKRKNRENVDVVVLNLDRKEMMERRGGTEMDEMEVKFKARIEVKEKEIKEVKVEEERSIVGWGGASQVFLVSHISTIKWIAKVNKKQLHILTVPGHSWAQIQLVYVSSILG